MSDLLRELLKPLPTLGTLRSRKVKPIFSTHMARRRLGGELRVLVENPGESIVADWREVDNILLSDLEMILLLRKQRRLRIFPPGYGFNPYLGPDARPAHVFELLGYLTAVGPVSATICASEPLGLYGTMYVGFWTELPDHEYGMVFAIVRNDEDIEYIRHGTRTHWLVSESI